ncbi:MAG: binding-protein-dependent transport system inner rane component [Pseudonocardiales bacterium]|nr:binding-protein-dependent transport system inner rane component [Pseudonocardiales bacterium]
MTALTMQPLAGRFGNPWLVFAVRRGRRLVVSLWLLVTASFLMIHLTPGDPVRATLGATAPQDLVDARRRALGLDEPLWTQYAHYLRNLLQGHLGTSLANDVPVSQTIGDRLPATLEIAVSAFLLTVLVSVPLGVGMAALTRGGRRRGAELAFTSMSVVVAAIPDFLVAVGLVFVFGVRLGWVPVAGRSGLDSYILPVVSLALLPTAILARIVRVEMLTALQADYIRTARAKRLGPLRVYLRHALPNAVTTSLTLGGLLLGALIAGTVLVENVMAWPGLGTTIVSSILSKDYPVVQGIVIVYGVGVLLINLAVDIGLAMLDPRSAIRES